MSTETLKPKTPAQRQADRKAREIASGNIQWKRWVHRDDAELLAKYAAKLARKRGLTKAKNVAKVSASQ